MSAMPTYTTRMINSEFDTSDEGSEHASPEAASRAAILAAATVARDLYAKGEELPQIEVIVSDRERIVARHLVTLSVANVSEEEG